MTRVDAAGVFRCCLDQEFPPEPNVGDVLPCRHCKTGGMRYVERPGGSCAWQAAWITLGHDWRNTTREAGDAR